MGIKPTETPGEYFKVYSSYNDRLRSWLVGFGVGMPAALLLNDVLSEKVLNSGNAKLIACYFISGTGIQIFSAALNKYLAWRQYNAAKSDQEISRFTNFLANAIGIDILIDLSSIILFGFGTYEVFKALV